MRWFTLAPFLGACLASTAWAQQAGEPWLIVPTTSTVGNAWMEPAASGIRAELLQRGVSVRSLRSTVQEFEAKGVAAPASITHAEVALWRERSRAGLWQLAMGDPEAALTELTEAHEVSRRAVEVLSREDAGAQTVLDTCLFLVRALRETDFSSDANILVRQCRELVPRGEPSPNMHPAPVMKLFARVDAIRAEQSATLRVDSAPRGCAVRINGQYFGETPSTVKSLLPANYRVQVECNANAHGRVHFADVSSGATAVLVDARFDRAVSTDPLLHLRYANAASEREHLNDDLRTITRVVPAAAVVRLGTPTPNTLVFERLEPTELRRSALAKVATGALGPSPGDVALAGRALASGACMDFTEAQPTNLSCDDLSVIARAEKPPSSARMPRGKLISGLTLVGVGSAALVSGYVLMAPRARAGEDWVAQLDSGEPPDGVAQQRWLNLGTSIAITASVGGAALVAAMPLALPKRAKPAWWAWLSGGAGVGLAAFSIAYGVTAEGKPSTSCSDLRISAPDAQICVRRGEETSVAILTGATAAPLLTIPLVYLFRKDRARLEPGVQVSGSGAHVSLRGQF